MNTQFINDLAKRLAETIPPGLEAFKKDLEKNFQTVLQSLFSKFELVTREEFDIQKKVLAKTRAKVEAIEKLLSKQEKLLKTKTTKKKASS